MKKLVTFNNFIFLLAFVMFFLQFAPFIGLQIYLSGDNTTISINFFTAAFGGTVLFQDGFNDIYRTFLPCAGLIIAFVFEIIALLLTLSKNKIKIGSLIATPFYITAGILLCLAVTLIKDSSVGISIGQPSSLVIYSMGTKFAISIMFIILGCFSAIDAIATFSKPKVQQVY